MKRFLLPIAAAVIGTAAHAQAVEAGQEDSLRMYRLQEIEVTATRADAATPVAYTDIARDEIARNSFGSDIPSVLALTPSMVATNETGIGIGATSVRLRGTDATRLNVTINGVSMNNPDSHSMYWYDTPDLISSVGTVQVQRGAGISTNGTGAFGGAVNMTTEALPTDFNGSASLSYGSYNTNKQAVQVSSGLMGGHWAVDARLTHIGSDGYIDRGATDLKSYMFQGAYYNGNTMLKLVSFGGKAKTYLTYNGVTKEDMKRYGRRYHDSGQYVTSDGPFVLADGTHVDYYDDQTDNYLQINNQLILNHRIDDRWVMNATAFYTYGLQAIQGRRMACGLHQPAERHRTGRPDPRKDHAQPPGRHQRLGRLFGTQPRPHVRRFVELLLLSPLGHAGLGGRPEEKRHPGALVRQRCRQTRRQRLRARQLDSRPGVAPVRRHAIPLCALPGMGRQRQLQLGHLRDAAYRRR